MATLGGDVLTLADIAQRADPNGMPAMIAETLHQAAPILNDIPWFPSNLPTGHRSAIRTGLPTVNLRRLNSGVTSSKSTVTQVTDSLSLLEAHSTVDCKQLELAGDEAAYRMQEAEAFIESMGQRVTGLIFYGDPTSDEREFQGLQPRYNTLGTNVLTGGSGDADVQSSIYLVGWGANKVFGIYPKNTQGGLQHNDLGKQLIQDQAETGLGNSKLLAYVDQFTWDCGLVVKDWRYVVRIANIYAVEALAAQAEQELTDYGTNILYQMLAATHRIPNLDACKPCFYMPRSLVEAFDKQNLARAANNVYTQTGLTRTESGLSFRGIPVKAIDQMVYTEAVVTFS